MQALTPKKTQKQKYKTVWEKSPDNKYFRMYLANITALIELEQNPLQKSYFQKLLLSYNK